MKPSGDGAPCVQVAVFSPLRRLFSYLPPVDGALPAIGARVQVPFGRGMRMGVVAGVEDCREGVGKLKPIAAVLDTEPLLAPPLRSLLHFGAAYYQHPLGAVWATALPGPLRQGKELPVFLSYRLTEAGRDALESARGARQRALLAAMAEGGSLSADALAERLEGYAGPLLKQCISRGWVASEPMSPGFPPPIPPSPFPLHPEQQAAVAAIQAAGGFAVFLLEGVTGSGKTEVYLEAIGPRLRAGGQALVLVPEISLTPQLVARFAARFGESQVLALHSDLPEGERLRRWAQARQGLAGVVIGTRSALFTALPHLSIIIVDEEHDPSFKQQEGWRYSARDLAVQRAHYEGVPVVMGSATPSLESLANVARGRYAHLRLRERAGGATPPSLECLPLRRQTLEGGLSPGLLAACAETLGRGEQVLLFLNRRGYAPAILCHDCGDVVPCHRCSVPMTWHRADRRLRCHYCGAEQRLLERCPTCDSAALIPVGQGTEQVEDVLRTHLPEVPVLRIDRDAVRRRGALEALFARVEEGEPCILVGTQMLAKGHHFPAVTLVGIVNADQGLFSADFRAPERLLQTVIQVAGRAGRAERPGRVLIQTHHPEHPLIQALLAGDYGAYAATLLKEREATGLPPVNPLAILRGEGRRRGDVNAFLEKAAALPHGAMDISGPLPALIERRAGLERAELWLTAPSRVQLQMELQQWIARVETLPGRRQVRWHLDVDPVTL